MMRRSGSIQLDDRDISDSERTKKKFGANLVMRGRTRLSDITNVPQRLPQIFPENEHLIVGKSTIAKECARLVKENSSLLRLLEDRNHIIECSKVEMQRLRLALQREQEQNHQLARANSQLLAELNIGKDKIKVMQHELACMKGTLKVKELLEFEYALRRNSEEQYDKTVRKGEQSDQWIEVEGDELYPTGIKRSCDNQKDPVKSHSSTGASSSNCRTKEKGRESGRRIKGDCKQSEDFFELDDLDASIEDRGIGKDSNADAFDAASLLKSRRRCSEKENECEAAQNLVLVAPASIERPSRRAKASICYKERPLNAKMRRDS